MPLGDLGNHNYGTKGWYDELSRRITEFSARGQKEIFTPNYRVEPLENRDYAILAIMALKFRNRYQRIKKMKVETDN